MGLSEAHTVRHESRFEEFNNVGARVITWVVIIVSGFLTVAILAAFFA